MGKAEVGHSRKRTGVRHTALKALLHQWTPIVDVQRTRHSLPSPLLFSSLIGPMRAHAQSGRRRYPREHVHPGRLRPPLPGPGGEVLQLPAGSSHVTLLWGVALDTPRALRHLPLGIVPVNVASCCLRHSVALALHTLARRTCIPLPRPILHLQGKQNTFLHRALQGMAARRLPPIEATAPGLELATQRLALLVSTWKACCGRHQPCLGSLPILCSPFIGSGAFCVRAGRVDP